VAAGADYAEFDVRVTADHELVALHRSHLRRCGPIAAMSYQRLCVQAGYEVPRVAALINLLAGRARAHIDLKVAAAADEALRLALALMPPAAVLVTTRDNGLARAIRVRHPEVPVGLAIGGDFAEFARYARQRLGAPAMTRLDDVLATGATWAAIHDRQAGPALLERCQEQGIGTLIWTVNGDRALRRWLASPLVSVVVTDRPARAVSLRDQIRPGPPRGPAGR
jgi:glycerophosphoryl diester phosphodiesterase